MPITDPLAHTNKRCAAHKHENCTYLLPEATPTYGAIQFSDERSVPVNLQMSAALIELNHLVDKIYSLLGEMQASMDESINRLKKNDASFFSTTKSKPAGKNLVAKFKKFIKAYSDKRKEFVKELGGLHTANQKKARLALGRMDKKLQVSAEKFHRLVKGVQTQFAALKSAT